MQLKYLNKDDNRLSNFLYTNIYQYLLVIQQTQESYQAISFNAFDKVTNYHQYLQAIHGLIS